jgi:effector-binding domain-containing protein
MAVQTKPTLETRAEQPCVSISLQIARAEIQQAIDLTGELFAWLEARGIPPAGPPYFRYYMIGGDGNWFDMEVGIAVQARVVGDGRVFPGTIPGGTYATLIHHGNPNRLYETHMLLHDWLKATGHRVKSVAEDRGEIITGMFEFYPTDPFVQPSMDEWDSEVAYLIR